MKEPLVIGYSRDKKGKVVSHHLKTLANTLTAQGGGTTAQYLFEPCVLRQERTEEEKNRRKIYGEKGAKFSASKQLLPRNDGVSNTLTSVLKDNLLLSPEHNTWRMVRDLVKGRRGGTGDATLQKDGIIRGRYNVGTHDSSISEMVFQHENNPSFTVTTTIIPKLYGMTTDFKIRKFTPP